MKRFSIVIFFIASLSGCVSLDIERYIVPLPDTVRLNSGDKVGVINTLRANPTHTNFGFLVWENFEKQIGTDWGVREALQTDVVAALASLGAEVVILDENDFDVDKVLSMVLPKDGEFHVKKPKLISKFKDDFGLRALIVLTEFDFSLLYGVPLESSFEVKHYGLYTTGRKDNLSIRMVGSFGMEAFHFSPTIASGVELPKGYSYPFMLEPKTASLDNQYDLTGQLEITDIKNISKEEMNGARDKMIRFVEKNGEAWQRAINYTFGEKSN